MDAGIKNLQLQALLSQTAVGLAVTDASGQLTMVSPALEEMFGALAATTAESDFAERFCLYDHRGEKPLADEMVPLTRARTGEVVRDTIVCALVPGRGMVPFRCNAAPLFDDDGAIDGAILLLQDVSTERAAVVEREELRDRLVSTINHEFRTPLAVLLGRLELLEDASASFDEHARYCLTTAINAGRRLDGLVRKVSQLVDLEAHTLLHKDETDLGRLARMSVAGCASRAYAVGMEVSVQTEGHLVAQADPVKVRSAITALVVNALVHAAGSRQVVVRVEGKDEYVELGVHDTGPGIPDRERERLVAPFESGADVHSPLSTSGLGLAVAATVASAHGGRLILDDNTPRGLSARLVLPRDAASAVPV